MKLGFVNIKSGGLEQREDNAKKKINTREREREYANILNRYT